MNDTTAQSRSSPPALGSQATCPADVFVPPGDSAPVLQVTTPLADVPNLPLVAASQTIPEALAAIRARQRQLGVSLCSLGGMQELLGCVAIQGGAEGFAAELGSI